MGLCYTFNTDPDDILSSAETGNIISLFTLSIRKCNVDQRYLRYMPGQVEFHVLTFRKTTVKIAVNSAVLFDNILSV